ncbi:MAG: 30S ribosomal protein S6 [Elusimicrobia bacterium]|nr:30S ribosomal protein S6 [Elusimicrobiota bacterium]
MQIYETVLILKPALSEAEAADFVEKTKQLIAAQGGEMISQDNWGRRKLTHMIGKAREGTYAYLKYKITSEALKKLYHNFSINENLLRQMTVASQERKMREKKGKAKKAPAAAGQE